MQNDSTATSCPSSLVFAVTAETVRRIGSGSSTWAAFCITYSKGNMTTGNTRTRRSLAIRVRRSDSLGTTSWMAVSSAS